jgi:ABC-type Mn2+/Zn2+ transport system permease subunit
MAIWVFSPFVALLWANIVSKGWSVMTRATLHGVMLAVALGSLAVYGADAVWPRKSQAAFVFVAVPPVSWLLITIVPMAACISGRMSRRRDDG